jgi:hypothetical protein
MRTKSLHYEHVLHKKWDTYLNDRTSRDLLPTIQTCPVTQKTLALGRKINPVSRVFHWEELGGQI